MRKRSWIRNLFTRPATRPIRRRPPRTRPGVEALEDRTVPSTFTVLNTLDDGSDGSLRWAVEQANSNEGADTIDFDSGVFSTPQTITLGGTQLELSDTTGTTTITGPAGGVTVSGGGLSRVFQVDEMVTASLSGMTITGGNAGYDYGGGVFNQGTLTLTNCTVSSNAASVGGGLATGSYFNRGGSTTLTNCTVSGNSGFAEVFTYFGTTALTNTIVAGEFSIFGAVSGSKNLIGAGGSGGLIDGVDGNIVGVADPGLAPLGQYGGTSLTMPLLPGSRAIDAGASGTGTPAIDQRGLNRVGAVDIGAFESQGFTVTLAPGSTPQSANIGTAFANPLAFSVTANNPVEPVDGAVIRFVAHPAANGASAIFLDPTAVITNGQAAVAAAPNNILGSYSVAPALVGFSGSFALTNTGTPFAALVVNTTSDALTPGTGLLSLREAIAFANSDSGAISTITFDERVFGAAQTITLTNGQLELSDTVGATTITGPKAGVTVSGGGLSRVFQVHELVTASLSGMTVTGGRVAGYGYGGGLLNHGTLTLTGCTVSGNNAYFGGGLANGSFSKPGGTLTLTDCTVSGNSTGTGGFSGGWGGGLFNSGAITLTDCTVSGNTTNGLFGIGGGMVNVLGTATLTGCTISTNSTSAGGGGLWSVLGTATLTDCAVTDNTSDFGPGGGLFIDGGAATLTDCNISGNSAPGGLIFDGVQGGGGLATSGTTTLTGCAISDNHAYASGGGVSVGGGTTTLTDCTVSGNSSNGNVDGFTLGGGGVSVRFGTATLNHCTISGNSAAGDGGGVFTNGGTATLTDCTVSGNSAVNGGGVATGEYSFFGYYSTPGTTHLSNCTVSGNTATGNGGGLANDAVSTTTVVDSNIRNNSAVAGGGIANDGTLTVAGSTISKNRATSKGGGISTTSGSATLTDSVINSNRVDSLFAALGGGISSENSVLSLTGCTVSANQANGATAQGGGIHVFNSTMTVQSCTVSANQANGATAQGGGIYALNSTVDVLSSTVNGNKANGTVLGEGGGIYSYDSVLTLLASTVKGNKASTGFDDVFDGP